jgi:hypothetical protein
VGAEWAGGAQTTYEAEGGSSSFRKFFKKVAAGHEILGKPRKFF